jgi:hypothetical protein
MLNTVPVRRFVLHILKKGFVTKKTQDFYSGIGYYLMTWHLRDNGIIVCDGIEQNKKTWRLTPKGQKLAMLFQEMEEVNKKIEEMIMK